MTPAISLLAGRTDDRQLSRTSTPVRIPFQELSACRSRSSLGKGPHPQELRHTAPTHEAEAPVGPLTIGPWLGHATAGRPERSTAIPTAPPPARTPRPEYGNRDAQQKGFVGSVHRTPTSM